MASPNTCESNLLLPPIISVPTACDVGESGGFVTISAGATGFYYDENTNTVLPYTNTFAFPLFEASKICLVGGNVVSFENSLRFTVQYFIDNVAVTTVSNLHQGMSVTILQFFIDADITNPNVTITVNSFNNLGLSVTITIQTLVAVSESKVVYTPVGEDQPPFFTSTFTCNLVPPNPAKKKNRGVGAIVRCPDEIIFKADISHPQVKYCRNNIYNFYGTDEQGLFHYIKSNSDISQRNTRFWWSLSI